MLFLLWFFHIFNNAAWLSRSEAGFIFDSLQHFLFSLGVFDWLQAGRFPFLAEIILYGASSSRWYGVFVGYLIAPLYFLSGRSEQAGAWLNGAIFLGILIFSVFGICRKMGSDKPTAYGAAALATFYPLIFTHTRTFELDLPLTAMVALSVYFLMAADYFSNRRFALFFGAAAGCGLLTKFNFFGFLAGPLIVSALKTEKKNRMNLVLALSLAAAIAARFYFLKSQEISERMYTTSWLHAVNYYPNPAHERPVLWLKAAGDYFSWLLSDMIENSVSFLFVAIFFMTLLPFLKSRAREKEMIWLWFLAPLCGLALIYHKPVVNRYIMPLLPAMAVTSAVGMAHIRPLFLRRTLAVFVAAFGLFQYTAISYPLNFLPEQIGFSLGTPRRFIFFNRRINLIHRNTILPFSYPAPIDWGEHEILGDINQRGAVARTNLFFIDAVPEVYSPLISRQATEGLPFEVAFIPLIGEATVLGQVLPSFLYLAAADYVVLKKDRVQNGGWQERLSLQPWIETRIRETRQNFLSYQGRYSFLGEIRLPDPDATVLEYYRRSEDYTFFSKGPLRVFFRDGLVKIFGVDEYGRISFVLHISLSFGDGEKLYHAFEAAWDMLEHDADSFAARGIFKDTGVAARYHFFFREDGALSWTMALEGAAASRAPEAQLDMFLSAADPTRFYCPSPENCIVENPLRPFAASLFISKGRLVLSAGGRQRSWRIRPQDSGRLAVFEGRMMAVERSGQR